MRVRITNRTDRTLGVDLRDPWRVVYPNQWGWSDSEQRLEINERRLAPRPIDHEALRAAHREGQLASLAARASLDYLRLFDSAGPEQPSQPRGRFLLLSLDGVLCATDGQRVDALTWWSTGDGAPRSEVALSPPTQLSDPPAGVLVVGPRRR